MRSKIILRKGDFSRRQRLALLKDIEARYPDVTVEFSDKVTRGTAIVAQTDEEEMRVYEWTPPVDEEQKEKTSGES